MTANLIQRLRTCSKEERRAVAVEFAHAERDGAVQELVKMTEGRRRRGLRWYDYDGQLIGIEALGETASEQALKFLERVYSSVCSDEEGKTFETHEIGPPSYESIRIEAFSFPWSKAELGERLKYSIELHEHQLTPFVLPFRATLLYRPIGDIEAELREIFGKPPHSVVQKSIRELEESVGREAQIIAVYDFSFNNNLSDIEGLMRDTIYWPQPIPRNSPSAFLSRQAVRRSIA